MKITEYTQISAIDDSTVLLADGSGGTKKILAKDLMRAIVEILPVESKRGFYGGKSLGTSVSDAQKAAIKNGSFKGMLIGDYWTISGKIYRIMDMDYWYNCGDTPLTSHHLVIVPDESLYNRQMNTTDVTTGAYVGSDMYINGLTQAKETIKAAFPNLVLNRKEYLTNAVASGGYPSAGAWKDSEVELMNEIMVYGCPVFLPAGNGSVIVNRYTTCNSQLAGFRLNPRLIKTRQTYWLRDVVSAAYFALVYYDGYPNSYNASNSYGVRPVFAIG